MEARVIVCVCVSVCDGAGGEGGGRGGDGNLLLTLDRRVYDTNCESPRKFCSLTLLSPLPSPDLTLPAEISRGRAVGPDHHFRHPVHNIVELRHK